MFCTPAKLGNLRPKLNFRYGPGVGAEHGTPSSCRQSPIEPLGRDAALSPAPGLRLHLRLHLRLGNSSAAEAIRTYSFLAFSSMKRLAASREPLFTVYTVYTSVNYEWLRSTLCR